MALAGVIAGLTTAVTWGLGDFNTKAVFARINVREYLVWSTTFYLAIVAALAPFFWNSPALTPVNVGIALLSGLIGGLGNIVFLVALSKDKLSLMTSLGAAYPVITIALGITFLNERIASMEIIGIILCVAGVILASMPTLGKPSVTSGTPFIAGAIVFWGIGFFLNKIATDAIGWYPTNLFISIIQFAMIVPYLLFTTDLRKGFKEGPLWRIFLSIALIAAGMLAFSIGVSLDRVSIITPLSSLFPVVAVVMGFLFLKEKLEMHQYAGIAVVIGGIVLLSV